MSAEELALEHFQSGFDCGEATFLAVCRTCGIEGGDSPSIAAPFGGGFAGCGLVCGAITGTTMAIGLALGRDSPTGSRDAAYATTQKLVDSFVEETGSTSCRELTGLDLRTEEGVARLFDPESGVLERVCAPAVAFAARCGAEILSEQSG